MAGHHIGVLALIFSFLLVLPSWSEKNQSNVDYENPIFPSLTRNNPTMINNDETPIIKEPYWTHNQTTDNQLKKGRERNAGEPHGKTKKGKKNKKIKNRNKKEKKLEKKYKKKNKYKNNSTRIATCPNGWTSLTTGCYRLLPESGDAKTLEEAKRACQSQGGFVVEIDSQNEQNALRQFWKNSISGGISWRDWVWIGATDSTKEGEWRWIHSGQKMSFTAWYSGEPNNSGNEDCVIAGYIGGEKFEWTDIGCQYSYTGHKALCEYPGGPACTGTESDWSCCSSESPCQEKQGDCDGHSECAGSLICGKDNCKDFNSKASKWADCCITKPGTGGSNDWEFCSLTSPCQEKQGDCDGDSECAGSLICGKDNCNDFHPLANIWADCCIIKPGTGGNNDWEFCSITSPCQEKQGDCDGDSECAGSLICGEDNCNDFHPLANIWADCCITDSSCKCGVKKQGTRIVGGSVSQVNEYPWMVLLSMGCGGSVVADRWILTAAHCFYRNQQLYYTSPQSITITLGEHDRTISTETLLTKLMIPDQIIIHDSYDPSKHTNDLALLRLPSAIDVTIYTPVCLPPQAEDYTGQKVWVYGWGALSESGSTSATLQELEITVVDDDVAKNKFGLSDTQLAAMVFAGGEKGKDACQGDSGGPLSYERNGQHELVGATSWGYGCAREGYPGAYTELSAFRSWIDQKIGGSNTC